MSFPIFDRSRIEFYPLSERENRVLIESAAVDPAQTPGPLPKPTQSVLDETAERLRHAREQNASRMLVFGAHAIKNGLGPVIAHLIEEGWITHLATNGAGIIHDWEFAFSGASSEHVAANIAEGKFGAWRETGEWINLALVVGAYRGLGYGASIGALVEEEGLDIPLRDELQDVIVSHAMADPSRTAAAADLLDVITQMDLTPGWREVPHPFKRYGMQATAYRLGVPFTGHPMIGHDIIYMHPMNRGAAVGRTAERDFLQFVDSVSGLENGVYISLGSAVMSPMVFEKSLSMARNVARQKDHRIDEMLMTVVDLAESNWDWQEGEPPEDRPEYYLRFNKSFSRMGGTMRYAQADNRDFLLGLANRLNK
jgi:hypothetical protein